MHLFTWLDQLCFVLIILPGVVESGCGVLLWCVAVVLNVYIVVVPTGESLTTGTSSESLFRYFDIT